MRHLDDVFLLHCEQCQRVGRDDERMGDTCGEPKATVFKVKTEQETIESIHRMLMGLPSNEMCRERCLGLLL